MSTATRVAARLRLRAGVTRGPHQTTILRRAQRSRDALLRDLTTTSEQVLLTATRSLQKAHASLMALEPEELRHGAGSRPMYLCPVCGVLQALGVASMMDWP